MQILSESMKLCKYNHVSIEKKLTTTGDSCLIGENKLHSSFKFAHINFNYFEKKCILRTNKYNIYLNNLF